MRVLVTRPEHAGHETAKRLIELGHDPLLLPLSRAVHNAAAAVQGLNQPHAAIAISSAEAIRAITPLCPLPPDVLDRPLFAVGAATATAASAFGFTDIRVAAGEGESLADLVAQDLQDGAKAKPLLYLAGSPRSPRFEARLAVHKVAVTVCDCYHMEPLDYPAEDLARRLRDEEPEIALFYSAEAARRFFSLHPDDSIPDALQNLRFLCLSTNVLAAIPTSFRSNGIAAATPDETALLALI